MEALSYCQLMERCGELEAQLADMVAENAALKAAASSLVSEYVMNKGTDSEFIACVTPSKKTIGTGGVWDMWRYLDLTLNETPATDAFLAEVRASGVDQFKEFMLTTGYPWEGDYHSIGRMTDLFAAKIREEAK